MTFRDVHEQWRRALATDLDGFGVERGDVRVFVATEATLRGRALRVRVPRTNMRIATAVSVKCQGESDASNVLSSFLSPRLTSISVLVRISASFCGGVAASSRSFITIYGRCLRHSFLDSADFDTNLPVRHEVQDASTRFKRV